MKQKTDGRVVRLLSKRRAAEEAGIEQWFLVAIRDDAKAKEAISSAAHGTDDVVEVAGTIPATRLASLGLTEGEVFQAIPSKLTKNSSLVNIKLGWTKRRSFRSRPTKLP